MVPVHLAPVRWVADMVVVLGGGWWVGGWRKGGERVVGVWRGDGVETNPKKSCMPHNTTVVVYVGVWGGGGVVGAVAGGEKGWRKGAAGGESNRKRVDGD